MRSPEHRAAARRRTCSSLDTKLHATGSWEHQVRPQKLVCVSERACPRFSRLENWVNVFFLICDSPPRPPTHRGALGPRGATPGPRSCTTFGPMQDRGMADRQDRWQTGGRRTPRLVLLRQYSRRGRNYLEKGETNPECDGSPAGTFSHTAGGTIITGDPH